MFGGFLRFRFDVEGLLEADLLLVVDGNVEELRQVFYLSFSYGGVVFCPFPNNLKKVWRAPLSSWVTSNAFFTKAAA